MVRRVLAGDTGPHRDIVLLNAGAALVVAGLADELGEGIELAARRDRRRARGGGARRRWCGVVAGVAARRRRRATARPDERDRRSRSGVVGEPRPRVRRAGHGARPPRPTSGPATAAGGAGRPTSTIPRRSRSVELGGTGAALGPDVDPDEPRPRLQRRGPGRWGGGGGDPALRRTGIAAEVVRGPDVLEVAARLEGHGDNALASQRGGVTVYDRERPVELRLAFDPEPRGRRVEPDRRHGIDQPLAGRAAERRSIAPTRRSTSAGWRCWSPPSTRRRRPAPRGHGRSAPPGDPAGRAARICRGAGGGRRGRSVGRMAVGVRSDRRVPLRTGRREPAGGCDCRRADRSEPWRSTGRASVPSTRPTPAEPGARRDQVRAWRRGGLVGRRGEVPVAGRRHVAVGGAGLAEPGEQECLVDDAARHRAVGSDRCRRLDRQCSTGVAATPPSTRAASSMIHHESPSATRTRPARRRASTRRRRLSAPSSALTPVARRRPPPRSAAERRGPHPLRQPFARPPSVAGEAPGRQSTARCVLGRLGRNPSRDSAPHRAARRCTGWRRAAAVNVRPSRVEQRRSGIAVWIASMTSAGHRPSTAGDRDGGPCGRGSSRSTGAATACRCRGGRSSTSRPGCRRGCSGGGSRRSAGSRSPRR